VTATSTRLAGVMRALRGSRTVPRTRFTSDGAWRPTPLSLLALVGGLAIFGIGDGLLLRSELGAAPWSVLAQGLSLRLAIGIGWATFAVSCIVLLLWLPLRQRPGLGTVLNIIVIAVFVALTYSFVTTPDSTLLRLLLVLAGIGLIGLGSGLYLTSGHGPGPRDGWMTGLHRVTGWPVGRVRLIIEVSVLVVGWLLGGTVGVGTALFALLIGQSVALGLAAVRRTFPAADDASSAAVVRAPADEPPFPEGDA